MAYVIPCVQTIPPGVRTTGCGHAGRQIPAAGVQAGRQLEALPLLLPLSGIIHNFSSHLLAAIEIATLDRMLVAAIGAVAAVVAHLPLRHALNAIVASKAARGAGSCL